MTSPPSKPYPANPMTQTLTILNKTFASLFTGAGLADVSAKLAGYRLLWGVELNPATAAVAEYNLGHPVHVASVIGFDWASVERPDHLHMSPPCQDFSVAKRKVKGS